MLQIANLSKAFGQQVICQNFNLQMKERDITLFVGASGSGKTTILRMINDLEKVDGGTIKIDGIALVDNGKYSDEQTIKAYHQNIGLVFQDYQLFPHLTVLENLLFAPTINKIDSRENLQTQALEWLKAFGLIDQKNVLPSVLSGGQKQRVAILRAMMMNPKLICFDEPTSALDNENTRSFVGLVQELRALGMAILIVTHDSQLVAALEEEATIIQSNQFIGL